MLIIILCLIGELLSQTQVNLNQPPFIETNTYTLRKTASGVVALSVNITYMQNYNCTSIPQVTTSLASLYSFTPLSNSSFTQSITTVQAKYFTLQYSFSCTANLISCSFSEIDIVYVAYDYTLYPYIQIFSFVHTLNQTITLNNQFYEMYYMNALVPSDLYQLNVMITGFVNLNLTGEPTLDVDVVQNDTATYLLQVQFYNLTVTSIQLVRILIDVTAMNNAWTSPSSLTSQTGTISLFADPLVIQSNPTPDYIPFGLFYGIKGFTAWNITLAQMPYIFTNTIPRIQAKIGYILFLTKSCAVNFSYVLNQNLCYSLSAAFYYQSTPTVLKRCPVSCYRCTGPLSTSCKSCVPGYNRYYVGGRCLCLAGFYDAGSAICLNCTLAIPGCYTCSSAVNCLTCMSGCTAIDFNPIYCDCPGHVQNISTNCALNYYFQYDLNSCMCYPQTYYSMDTGLCLPCKIGCYICVNNASYCLVCIDEYTLINNTCSYFYISYSLLGQSSNTNSPQLRCMRWSVDNSKCLSTCKYYYYQSNCYFKCPIGTFNISFPWPTCQSCKINCLFCYNFSICYKCNAQYYYFNTTIKTCSSCSANCITCINNTYCTLCQNPYQLNNNFCFLAQISLPSCPQHCVFCLVSQVCQICRATYYLNFTSGLCITCSRSLGLYIGQGGVCYELCGDGLIVNNECDDSNNESRDGCSSSCKVEQYFECQQILNRSYCWSSRISLFWSISTVFNRNQIVIDVWSDLVILSNNLASTDCSFNYTTQSVNTNQKGYTITVQYHQSILMSANSNDSNTYNYFSTGNSSSMCRITVNQAYTYPILINTFPESLYIDYNSFWESILQSRLLCNIATYCLYLCLAFIVVGVTPLSAYSSVRVCILVIVSYMDYSQIPINSFSPFQALQTLLFESGTSSTAYLVEFDSSYYFAIVWRIFLLYVGTVFFQQILNRVLLILYKKMGFQFLTKIAVHQTQNKPMVYLTIYSCYEVIVYIIFFNTIVNFRVCSVNLRVFSFIHLVILLLTKLHFYFTKEIIQKNNYSFYPALVIDNIENFTVALFMQFSTQNASFTSLLIIAYAGLSLISLFQIRPLTYSRLTQDEHFQKSQAICAWQYRVGLFLVMFFQLVKLINMWRGAFISDSRYYEHLGEVDGLLMTVCVYLIIYSSVILSCIVHIVRIYEIRSVKIQQQQIVGPISVDSSSLSDMNN